MTNNEGWELKAVEAGRNSGDLLAPIVYCPELHFSEFASSVADMKNSVAVSISIVNSQYAISQPQNMFCIRHLFFPMLYFPSPLSMFFSRNEFAHICCCFIMFLFPFVFVFVCLVGSYWTQQISLLLGKLFSNLCFCWNLQNRNNAQSSCAGLFIAANLGFDFAGSWIHVDMALPVHCVSSQFQCFFYIMSDILNDLIGSVSVYSWGFFYPSFFVW